MKLQVGKHYFTRAKLREGVNTGKVVTKDEYIKVFGSDNLHYGQSDKCIVIYGMGSSVVTYALLNENGRANAFEEREHDLIRPVGNILNE